MATTKRRGSRRGTTEEETPRRSRRGTSSTSRGRTRGSRDEEEYDEEPEEGSADEDEDDEPRGRSRRGSSRGSRRGRSSSTEDERPSRRRRGSSDAEDDSDRPSRARGRRGWGAADEQHSITKSSTTGYVPSDMIWKPDDEFTLVKFVADEPFVSYAQHWINSKPKGRAGWECIAPLPYDDTDEGFEKYGEVGDCPLCEFLDDGPRMQVMFNVIIFNEDTEEWEYRVLRAGVTLTDQLKALNEGRHGPLSKYYWEIMATGTKGSYSPNCSVVRDRDLPEDWDLDPLSDEEIAELTAEAYDEDVVSFPTYRQLEDLIDTMMES